MMRLLIIVVVLLAITAGGVFFLLENPDRFKSQITQVTEANTGYRMKIDGELSWRYWPPVAINVSDISLARGSEAPFAEFDTMSIDLDLMPLLTQQSVIDVNDVTLAGGSIALVIDELGYANWEITDTKNSQGQSSSPAESTDNAVASSVQQLSIKDVSLTYQDKNTGDDYDVRLQHLITSELASDKPFDMSLVLSLRDNAADLSADVDATGRLSFQADTGRVNLMDLVSSIDLSVEGQRYPTLNLTTDGQWRPEEQALLLNRNDAQISTLRMSMTGLVQLAGNSPRFDGVMNLESADGAGLGRDLGAEIPIEYLQLESDFGATPQLLQFRTLSGRFDDSEITGSAVVSLSSPMKIKTDLRINQLNAENYLADAQSETTVATSRSDVAPDSELIPLDLLKETHADATIRIAALKYDTYDLADAKLTISNNGKILDVIGNAKIYGGKVVLTLNSLLQQQVNSDIRLNLEGINITELIEMQGITGTIAANSSLNFSGTMLSDVNHNLSGKTTFNVKDGSLDVRPLKSIAQTVDLLRGKTSSVSEWPDIMPFSHMVGQHVFQQGTRSGQILNMNVENLSITALGGLDLQAETLDYDVTAMFKKTDDGAFQVSEQLAGVRWPLSCSGSINASPGELCFGKDGAIEDLVADIVAQDLKRRGNKELNKLIDEKVPDEYKGIANDLLKNIFK